jgi:hypothetical protein
LPIRQRQHVLSEWLLKAFARPVGGHFVVTAFDKSTGEFTEADVADTCSL